MASPEGVICTPSELALSISSDRFGLAVLHCLTRGQSLGLLVVALSGLLSLVAVLVVLSLILRNVIDHVIRHRPFRVIKRPIEAYLLSLFLADLLQALGAVMDIKWVNEGKVAQGAFCKAQGTVQTIGETAVALTTLAITVHTFRAVWWFQSPTSLLVPSIVIITIWVFVVLFATVSAAVHSNPRAMVYTPTPYWCWINTSHYLAYQIAAEYLWLWVALFISLLLYFPIYFWSRGNITIDEIRPWKFRIHRRKIESNSGSRASPSTWIYYPIVYCILVLPLSITRFVQFHQEHTGSRQNHVPSAATFTSTTIFGLSGIANVLLFFITRQGLFLFGDDVDEREGALAMIDQSVA